MTEILNEQICGSVKSSTGDIHIVCEVRLSRKGVIMAIIGGSIYHLAAEDADQKYIGSFSVSYDAQAENNRAIAVNLNDSSHFSKVTLAIDTMITELEAKYK